MRAPGIRRVGLASPTAACGMWANPASLRQAPSSPTDIAPTAHPFCRLVPSPASRTLICTNDASIYPTQWVCSIPKGQCSMPCPGESASISGLNLIA